MVPHQVEINSTPPSVQSAGHKTIAPAQNMLVLRGNRRYKPLGTEQVTTVWEDTCSISMKTFWIQCESILRLQVSWLKKKNTKTTWQKNPQQKKKNQTKSKSTWRQQSNRQGLPRKAEGKETTNSRLVSHPSTLPSKYFYKTTTSSSRVPSHNACEVLNSL